MRVKRSWTIQSFITCFLFNGLLVGGFFYVAGEIFLIIHQWTDLFGKELGADAPENIRLAIGNLNGFIGQVEHYLLPVVFGVGGGITFILWLLIQFEGRRAVNRASKEAALIPSEPAADVFEGKTVFPEEEEEKETVEKTVKSKPEPKPERYVQPSPGAAIQILSLLQRQGRLIDFLQEDLSHYEDDQIGAAVRNIHEGCKNAIKEHVRLEPIFKEEEGTEVNVSSGFDSNAIQLTGNVIGDPPFRGILRHRGWRAVNVELPRPTSDQQGNWVVAPAEVELD